MRGKQFRKPVSAVVLATAVGAVLTAAIGVTAYAHETRLVGPNDEYRIVTG